MVSSGMTSNMMITMTKAYMDYDKDNELCSINQLMSQYTIRQYIRIVNDNYDISHIVVLHDDIA